METTECLVSADWPAPTNVRVAMTTRAGGVSIAPFDSNNLGTHVGDNDIAVAANRAALQQQLALPTQPQWLEQIHGTRVVAAATDGRVRTADGCYSREAGVACAVMTADCLPVLICDRQGTQVAAVHAGWRGLAKGILAEALESFSCDAAQLLVYFGPALGSDHFEVGIEVLETFFAAARTPAQAEAVSAAFRPSPKPLHFYADLYALARAELATLGVEAIYGGDCCTYGDPQRFYSYRRDGKTGRMASLIWLA